MAIYTTYYTRYFTKNYNTKNGSAKMEYVSAKGFLLASLLIAGRCTPLLAQADTEQEMVEQEMPDSALDQDGIEAEQDDTEQESASQDSLSQDSIAQDSLEQDSTDQSGLEQDSAPQDSSNAVETSGQDAQGQAEPAATPAMQTMEAQIQTEPELTESATRSVVAPAQIQSQKAGVEKTGATQKTAQEIPALVLEEKPVQAPKPPVASPAPASPAVTQPASPVATKAPVPKVDSVVLEDDIVGIDTVNLDDPQGNWLFKRIWWERAEKKIEKIRRLVNAVFESRVIFLAQRTDIDRNVLDPFYVAVGLGQGELKRILDELIGRLEKEREKEGALSDQERGILQELRKEESALKQMKTDVESVARIDHDIDEALNALFEQINKVREYEGDAWDNFKEIARVLNDIKARELYYTMDIIAKNIEDIQAYIQQDYTRHFNQLSVAAKQQVERLKKSIEAMREKGLDLGKQLEFLEQQEKVRASGQQLEDRDEQEPEAELGFFSSYVMAPIYYIGNGLKTLFDGIVSVVTWPITYVTGGSGNSDQEPKEEDED